MKAWCDDPEIIWNTMEAIRLSTYQDSENRDHVDSVSLLAELDARGYMIVRKP
jgi:hypothetical protein